MSKYNSKNLVKKFFQGRGKDKTKIRFNPYRDWGVILVVFFILLLLMSAISMYFFTMIKKEEIFAKERPSEEDIEMLNTKDLKKTIEFFDKRAEKFDKLLEQKPDIVDPSR